MVALYGHANIIIIQEKEKGKHKGLPQQIQPRDCPNRFNQRIQPTDLPNRFNQRIAPTDSTKGLPQQIQPTDHPQIYPTDQQRKVK